VIRESLRSSVNHFPNTAAITHKHSLVASLREAGGEGLHDVAPRSFLFPAEAEELAAVAAEEDEEQKREDAMVDERLRSLPLHRQMVSTAAEGGERGGGGSGGGGGGGDLSLGSGSNDGLSLDSGRQLSATQPINDREGRYRARRCDAKWIVKRAVGGEGKGITVCANAAVGSSSSFPVSTRVAQFLSG